MNIEILHWLGCLLALAAGSVLTFQSLMGIRYKYASHDVLLLYLLVIVPDCVLYLNYLPFFSYSIVNGSMPSGAACTLSGFVIVTSICATNIAICFQSYAVYARVVYQRQITLNHIYIYLVISWLIGIAMAILYLDQFGIGPYKGLYCCVGGKYTWGNSIPIFFCFSLSFLSILVCYVKLFWYTKEVRDHIRASAAIVPQDELLWSVVRQGLVVLVGYYAAWFGVVLNSLLELTGYEYPLWRDVLASWAIKGGAVFDALMCLAAYRKLRAYDPIPLEDLIAHARHEAMSPRIRRSQIFPISSPDTRNRGNQYGNAQRASSIEF
eukprot:TRINITY_DN7446_c0_g5_i3.p1 TRINITY_DN7446_c0_g5~~TRINITY_DN7446_c0_g5_i3.p1  ORF type:complete len:323 (-),score=1.14 TRINITY_DN7446_c0_g5_i3:152-1120(-)